MIGIGNPIMKDDGIGIQVIRHLKDKAPEGVDLVEGSVYSADLLPMLEGRSKAVFVDGIDAGEEPGSVFRFTPDQVRNRSGAPLSLHDYGLYDLINAAILLDQCPENITLIAIQVKEVDPGRTMSDELVEAVPRAAGLVLLEIGCADD